MFQTITSCICLNYNWIKLILVVWHGSTIKIYYKREHVELIQTIYDANFGVGVVWIQGSNWHYIYLLEIILIVKYIF